MSKQFPPGFIWGVSTSSYQIEGAVNEGGRGVSVWDTFSHLPGKIANDDNGDVACDHYHRYPEDIALIADLGVSAYRFSIAWPRVQPTGSGAWNEEGWAFYERVIEELERKGIAPHVTLNHWDLPQALEDAGGWRNRETVDRFTEYAAEFARRFGKRVRSVATHNEPWVVAILGHEMGIFAPGIKDRAAAYQVSHHLLLSHGKALRAMRAERTTAALGIVLNQSPAYPADPNSEADRAAARLGDGTLNRWYMDPIFRGAYPADVIAHLGADAPKIEAGDMEIIATPMDFLGINFYMRQFCSAAQLPQQPPYEYGKTEMGWEVYPPALAAHLVRLAFDYSPPPIYITENGCAMPDVLEGDAVHDPRRTEYFRTHLDAVAQARAMGADVQGYFAWSLMDNFEWAEGYNKRFGLVYVDYASQRRVLKDSALWYRDFIRAQGATQTKD